ncbi:hypothetical protein [Pelagovum pacificum]|uniref:50S ribosomal protein L35 n=1 Tax=Pelagovum pacificum TaxID=2588711 RepID=A0A5C5GAB9_9RHOB|nr:hypothetical protein [Pelagovum pacificum]QQA42527.1 hypothetical protein I8N54_17340 [Pelagovum pacificum]TNY31611.1 hypothetical protein FHY64_16535 [Pelagovum pacificum]
MDTDLIFLIGLLVSGFAVPAVIGAFTDGRPPRTAAIMFMIGGGLLALAISESGAGYDIAEIPDVFVRVVGRYIN